MTQDTFIVRHYSQDVLIFDNVTGALDQSGVCVTSCRPSLSHFVPSLCHNDNMAPTFQHPDHYENDALKHICLEKIGTKTIHASIALLGSNCSPICFCVLSRVIICVLFPVPSKKQKQAKKRISRDNTSETKM